MDIPPDHAPPTFIDLHASLSHSGPQFGHQSDDLNATLLAWKSGEGVAPHVNTEVDVVLVVVQGEGEATIDGQVFTLRDGAALLIPKGCERSILCVGETFSYLSVHKRRRGLMPTVGGRAL